MKKLVSIGLCLVFITSIFLNLQFANAQDEQRTAVVSYDATDITENFTSQ